MNPFLNIPQYTSYRSILLHHLKKEQYLMSKRNDKPLARILKVELTETGTTSIVVDERKLEDQVYTDLTQNIDAYSFITTPTETTFLGDSNESR